MKKGRGFFLRRRRADGRNEVVDVWIGVALDSDLLCDALEEHCDEDDEEEEEEQDSPSA